MDELGSPQSGSARGRIAAAKNAAALYASLHGHLPGDGNEFDDENAVSGFPARRWALSSRTALVAAGAALVIAVAVGAAAVWPRSADVETLALAGPVAAGGVGTSAAGAGTPQPDSGAGGDSAVLAGASTPDALLVVSVVGQVNSPGLVTLPQGSRVFDAIDGAGGATPDANLAAINLARFVVDGEQIVVPAPGETVIEPPGQTGTAGGRAGSGASGSGAPGLVNINTADAARLDDLPGVGPALAARIIAWRTDNGPFASVDELDEVSGIGPAIMAKLRDLVTVS
jgi:competence protein ComEA